MNTLEEMLILMIDSQTSDPKEREKLEQLAVRMKAGIDKLPETEKKVVAAIYGLDGNEHKTYADIASELNIPPAEVQAAHTRALRLLRNID